MERFRHQLSKSQVEMICALYSKTVGRLMLGGFVVDLLTALPVNPVASYSKENVTCF